MASTITAGTTSGTALNFAGDTSGILTVQGVPIGSTTGLGTGNASIMKNRIINGAMVIDQRNAGASVTPTNGQYTVDRWQAVLSQASKFSVQQNAGSVTLPAGFTNYLGITSTSAYTVGSSELFNLVHSIEAFNFNDFDWGTANAKTVTISFWVRSSLTGTFGGALNNGSANRFYPFSYTISAANTWEQKSVTIAGDTSGTWAGTNGAGLQIRFGLGVGSTVSGTAGSWSGSTYYSTTGATSVVGTNGATFYITGVQLEVGSSATGFEYVNYQTSLANCQRYCRTIGADSGTDKAQFSGVAYLNNTIIGSYTFPTMRSTPTATILFATSIDVVTSVVTAVNNTLSASELTSNSAQIAVANSGTPFTAGHGAVVRSDGMSIILSAEL
jgi:hypothetical protein